jgi:oxygen-independent coproporphyrinogen-3 oxidase
MPGLYLHIPYCVKKCAYCDFVSFPDDGTIGDYCDALCREMELTVAAGLCDLLFDTVYIGGGTPSLLSGKQMEKLLSTLKTVFPVAEDAEISMESNPGTTTPENLAAYREAGVNRLSVGLQSSCDEILKLIGRIHQYREFERTVQDARDAGFDNINVDVMHGLPGQTEARYLETLKNVCDLDVEHISSYSLILSEDTPLFVRAKKGEVGLPDADCVADMQDAGFDYLAKRGYARYEISNFCKPGKECRHNLNYWNNGEYLGLGVAAHSALRMSEWTRYANVEDRKEYYRLIGRNRRPVREIIRLYPADELFESVMLGLRMVQGVNRAAFRARFGVDMAEAYPTAMEKLRERGWVRESQTYIALTKKGLDLQNQALQFFM